MFNKHKLKTVSYWSTFSDIIDSEPTSQLKQIPNLFNLLAHCQTPVYSHAGHGLGWPSA